MIPQHISYSALSAYEQCPRSYYLGRIKRAEEKPTWFFPVGTSVHNMIEDHLTGKEVKPAEEYFYPLIQQQLKIDSDDINWLAGGSADDPVIRDKALDQVKRCFEAALIFLGDIDVWHVEYDATGLMPGCEVPIKAYIDIVGEHTKHGPVIVDWKSGKSKPKNNLQLETYSVLWNAVQECNNKMVDIGLWAMINPDAPNARPVKGLSQVDASALGARYQAAYDAIKDRKWQSNAGYHCRFCTQAPNCLIEAGPTARALFYDKSEEDGYPF